MQHLKLLSYVKHVLIDLATKIYNLEINFLPLVTSWLTRARNINFEPCNISILTNSLKLFRILPPKLLDRFGNVTKHEGEELVLSVRVTGTQPIQVTWIKDDTTLKSGERIHISTEGEKHTLTIKPVEQDDEGDYLIVAKNTVGIDKWEAEVLVEGKGIFARQTLLFSFTLLLKCY